jgi:hypothetical protein
VKIEYLHHHLPILVVYLIYIILDFLNLLHTSLFTVFTVNHCITMSEDKKVNGPVYC